MPVSSESSVSDAYYPNGVAVDFGFDFKAASASEVVAVDAAGNTISPALYSVTLDEDEGGTLTFATAPSASAYPVIYVVSDPALTQPSDFDNAGPSFNPAGVTRAFDRAATRDLKQQREIDRSIKVPFGEVGPSLPPLAYRTGKFAAFDGSGGITAVSGLLAVPALAVNIAIDGGGNAQEFIVAAQAKLDEVMSLRDKGARGVSAATDSAALALAFAAMLARTPTGGLVVPGTRLIKLNGSFAMPRETRLDMTGAVIEATSTTRLFDFGWNTTGTVNTVGRGEIIGGRWNLTGNGGRFVGMQNAGTARFRDIDLNLLSSNQVGFHIKACNDPHAPYYGNMSDNRVRGNAAPGSGQIGYLLEGLPELGSLTINRWTIDNASDCAAVDVGWDIRGSDGLVLNNINCESCYTAAWRFGATNRSITTTVTTAGATPGSFTATGLIGATLDQAATIIINSGPNIYQSGRIISYDPATGLVTLPPGMPYKFTVGNSFTITEAKARNVGVSNATYEGGVPTQAVVNFTPGALACEVGFRMLSIEGGNLMQRAVAEMSNTIARQYDTFVAEKKLTAGSGTENFESDWTASNQGGFVLPRGGWVDAVFVSGFIRAFDASDGEIEIDVLVNGAAVPNLTAKLTRHSPYFGRAVRLTLTNGDFLPAGTNIQVRAYKVGMAIAERVRAQVMIGYL